MFMEQFSFDSHALVNFVGAGGKTALIHTLMQEYSNLGTVLCTTTTRIHPPDPGKGFAVVSSDNLNLLKQFVDSVGNNCPDRSFKLIVTRSYLSPTLLRGVPPDFDNGLERKCFQILLNEADGAASFSLKMPKDSEPVLMENAEYLVPVIGLDCLHQRVESKVIFRYQKFVEHFPGHERGHITSKLAADILMHSQGVCKGWKPGMIIIPFINKVDTPAQDAAAQELAHRILRNRNFPVDRVLFGSVVNARVDSIGPE